MVIEPVDLSIWMLLLVFIVTFLSKTYGVIVGGASFVLQPFLLAIGIPPQMAVAHDITSTNGCNVTGIYVFNKQGQIKKEIARYALPGLIIGPFIGVWLLSVTPPEYIENFIATVSILGAIYLLVRRRGQIGLVERDRPENWRVLTIIYGLLFGAYLGFSGAGGGIAVTLFYISVLGMTMTQSVATKRYVHAIPFITAGIGYFWQGWLQWDLLLAMFAGCLVAGYAGSHLTLRINDKILKIVFMGMAICMAAMVILT